MPAARRALAGPGGVLAAIRLAAIPVFFVAERFVDHPRENTGGFGVLLVAAGLYALAAFGAELRGRQLAPPTVLAAADLTFITALVATSGGPFSQLRYAYFVLPVGAALLLGPRSTALASAAGVLSYGVVAATYPGASAVRSDAIAFELTQALFLVWMGVAATLLSGILARRTREIERLSASRGRLVAQTLDAEDVARRRLAEGLHDHALQSLLAARQLLGSDLPEDRALAIQGLDDGVRQIRDAVFDLHPYVLDQAGLRAALQAITDHAARRAGFTPVVRVGAEAEGVHDQLLFGIARELIGNAAKHAEARQVRVAVWREDDAVILTVEDDGRGLDPGRAKSAPARGHIGLASCAERAEAIGGAFSFGPGPAGQGTTVRVSLPAPVR